ncbi:unnamed protein product [Aphanomyces euteiches]
MSIDPKSFLVLSQAERASCKMAPAVANYIEVTGGGSKWPSALDHYWGRRRRWKSLASSMVVKQDSSFQVSPFMKKLPIGYGNSVTQKQADDAGAQLMFANSYHLLLQPGPEIIREAGGLHKFMGRRRPIITDSGGFQVFSLAYGSVHEELKGKGKQNKYKTNDASAVIKIDESGVVFKSYRDGRRITLTPESSVQAQKAYGADVIIPFDELPPYHITADKLEESVLRTHRWEARSLMEHLKDVQQQAMYGVIHGMLHNDRSMF